MKKIICLLLSAILLSSIAFAASYEVNVSGLSKSEKNELVEWLEEQGWDYDVEESDSYNYYDEGTITVKKLTSSKKNILVNWLYYYSYEYTSEYKNGYYYVTIEYRDSTEWTLTSYLKNNGYNFSYSDSSSSNSSSSYRSGQAYLVANGYLWYADGDEIQRVDSIYSEEYVLFTENGALSYINNSKYGMLIEDIVEPEDKEMVASSVTSITKNSAGYATYFRRSSSSTRIDTDSYFNNSNMTVYVVKNNTLYSLSSKNKLTKLKSLKSVSTSSSSYYNYKSNIGFSEWGDLVLIDSSGKCYFNEQIDDTSEIEVLKDEDRNTVYAKYFTLDNGVVETVTLSNGRTVELIDE